MAYTKTKELLKGIIKEGSLNILAYAVSCIIVLSTIKDPLIALIFTIIFALGFIISFAIMTTRIIVNQYIAIKLKLDKLKSDMVKDNYEDLEKEDSITNVAKELINPIMTELISFIKDKFANKKTIPVIETKVAEVLQKTDIHQP